MTKTAATQRQRTPGRLNRKLDSFILDAALAALTEHGYEAMNMDDVAARAEVGKAAIYRRWPSKAALVADTLIHGRPSLEDDDAPDTGTLRGDLYAMCDELPDAGEGNPLTSTALAHVIAAAINDPALAAVLDDLLLSRSQRRFQLIFTRAVQRGEIPDRDWSFLYDIPLGLSLAAVLKGVAVDQAHLRGIFDNVVLPLVRAPLE